MKCNSMDSAYKQLLLCVRLIYVILFPTANHCAALPRLRLVGWSAMRQLQAKTRYEDMVVTPEKAGLALLIDCFVNSGTSSRV